MAGVSEAVGATIGESTDDQLGADVGPIETPESPLGCEDGNPELTRE
jgi:hypothetical protein